MSRFKVFLIGWKTVLFEISQLSSVATTTAQGSNWPHLDPQTFATQQRGWWFATTPAITSFFADVHSANDEQYEKWAQINVASQWLCGCGRRRRRRRGEITGHSNATRWWVLDASQERLDEIPTWLTFHQLTSMWRTCSLSNEAITVDRRSVACRKGASVWIDN